MFNSDNNFDDIENLKNRITSLKRELKKEINYNELAKAIKYGFKKNFDFELIDDSLANEEIELAKRLREEKYKTDEWNFGLRQENLI